MFSPCINSAHTSALACVCSTINLSYHVSLGDTQNCDGSCKLRQIEYVFNAAEKRLLEFGICATLSVSLGCVVVLISCFDDLLSIHFNGMREFVKPNETKTQSFNANEMRIRFRALGRKTQWITYSYGRVFFPNSILLLVSCWIIAWNEWHQTKKCIFLIANWNYVSFDSYLIFVWALGLCLI